MPGRRGTSDSEPAVAPTASSGAGGKGIGLAIAATMLTLFAAFPFVTIVLLYTFVTIYAIVRAIGPGGGEDPIAIVVGFVSIASALTTAIAGTAYLLGRSITPRKRARYDRARNASTDRGVLPEQAA